MSGGPETEDPEQTSDDRAPGSLIADKYRVERAIGSGATGTVYLCEHVGLDRWVALKVLHRENEQNGEFVQRFKREAKAASRLEHPNSVRVLDFGQEKSGALYIVMEYIEGRDLLRVLDEDGPFSAERAVDVMSQILDALSMAHNSGIVHRDLKPENVVVRSVLVDGQEQELVTVCDFGIAQLAPIRLSGASESELISISDVGTVVGTPAYMSPEQARAESQDARSDIYSAGVVLFQLLTLQLPFVADTPLAVAVMHCSDPPPRPSQYGAVNPALEAICLKALSKTPEARYQTADEMRSDLQRALGRTGAQASRRRTPLRWTPTRAPAATYPAAEPNSRLITYPAAELGSRPAPGASDAPPGAALAPVSLWPVERLLAPMAASGRVRNLSLPMLGAAAAVVATVVLSLALRGGAVRRSAPSELQLPAAAAKPAAQASETSTTALSAAPVVQVPKSEGTGPAAVATAETSPAGAANQPASGGVILGAATESPAPEAAQNSRAPVPESTEAQAPAQRDNQVASAAPAKALDKSAATRAAGVRSTEKPLSAAAVSSKGAPVAALGITQPSAADKARRGANTPAPIGTATDAASTASAAPPVSAPPAAAVAAAAPKPAVAPPPKPAAPATVPATASVNVGPITTHGAVSKASIRNALNMDAITACYRAALRSNAVPATSVSSQLDLATTMGGGIKSATLRVTGFAEQPRQCIEQVARRGRVKEVDTGVAEASITLFFQPR